MQSLHSSYKLSKIIRHILLILCFQSAHFLYGDIHELRDGIRYEHRLTNDPNSIHLVYIQPQKVVMRSVRALENGIGAETLLNMVKRNGACVGINGGFYKVKDRYIRRPAGVLKIQGQWYSLNPIKNRGAIAWNKDNSTVVIDRIHIEKSITINENNYPIHDINRHREDDEAIVYTWAFHRNSLSMPGGTEIAVDKAGSVHAIYTTSSNPIPVDGFIYSIGHKVPIDLSHIHIGDHVQVHIHPTPLLTANEKEYSLWKNSDTIVGGTPVLIKNFECITDFSPEATLSTFLTKKFPRTAVGKFKDGTLVFVVVDGRNPGHSIGMTIPELCTFMKELGCQEAVNLDGGSSSSMVIGNELVNFPLNASDDEVPTTFIKVEDHLSDAILIFPKK